MMKQMGRTRGRMAALATAVALTLAGQAGALGCVAPTPALECEGAACAQVVLTFDEARQQYKVQNDASRAVIVEGANLVATARVRVGAGQSDYLPLKSIVGAYRADYE